MTRDIYSGMSEMHFDALREIGNIGSGNAATALASMLDIPVSIEVPIIRIMDFQEVTEELGGPENMIVGLLLKMAGDVEGMLMFLLEQNFAHMAVNTLLGQELEEFSQEDEMTMSVIQEVGNIMAGSYVNAIAGLTGMTIDISVPSICIDMVGAMLSVPAIYFANISDKIIYIEDRFFHKEKSANSHILMIPDEKSLKQIMTNLGIGL